MKAFITAILIVSALASAACSAPSSDTAAKSDELSVKMAAGDQEMLDAVDEARANFEVFLKAHDENDGKNSAFLIKIGRPTPDKRGTEFLWVTGDSYKDGKWTGRVATRPTVLTDVHQGDTVAYTDDDIEDWAFSRDGKDYGQFTTRVMLKHAPADQANKEQSRLAPTPLPPEPR